MSLPSHVYWVNGVLFVKYLIKVLVPPLGFVNIFFFDWPHLLIS